MLEGTKIGDFLFAVNGTQYDAFGQFVFNTQEIGLNKIGGSLDGQGGLTGEIAELMVFDSALTNRMSKKIEGYLALKWGLRDDLPGNHPYKSNNATFGGNQNITFPDVGNQVVSTGTIELGAFANSGLPITYTSSDATVLSISGRIATIHKDGNVTITASQAGDNHYTAAANKTSSFTISKEDQTITFTSPPDMNKYDDDIQLIASSSAGLPITFTINSGPAEILNGTTDVLHIINDTAGFVNITASQAGNVAYNAATPVTHTFEINNKEPQSITFVEKGQSGSPLRDIVLGPRPFLIPLEGITGGDSGNPVQVTVTGGTAASGVRTNVITKPNGKKFLRVLSTSSGTVQLTATQNGGLNGGSDYNPATPITREFELRAPTLANFKLSMQDHPRYNHFFNRFSSKRTGKVNPATGFNWTPTEIQNAFLSNDGDPEGDGVPTLLEYAWGGDPLGFDTDERKNKPRKKPLKRGGGNENFNLAFIRRSSAVDPNLSYTVEISTDMVSWSSSGVTQVSSRSIDGGMEHVVYKIDRAFTQDRNQFMRVNVTSSE